MGERVDSPAVVSVDWLADRLDAATAPDPELRVVEVDADPGSYADGHVPGAVGWTFEGALQASDSRDLPSAETFAARCEAAGIGPETTVVLYGDRDNWAAAFAFWTFRYFGHDDVRLLDGGRQRWIDAGGELTRADPDPNRATYTADGPYDSVRAYESDVQRALDVDATLIDTRSRAEYEGEAIAPPGERPLSRRGGRIPGAVHLPWHDLVTDDGTFKSEAALRETLADAGVGREDWTVAYCRLGKRSALAWVVLAEVLEFPQVTNYDGSWTEWGNRVGAPIEIGH